MVEPMNRKVDDAWNLATWEGSRRAQLRVARQMTVRERLEALDEMGKLVRHFDWMRRNGKFSSPGRGDGA